MKKIIFLLMVMCLTITINMQAQTDKGTVLLGVSTRTGLSLFNTTGCSADIMSLGFSTAKYKSDSYSDDDPEKITSLNLSPRIGYFLADNFVFGADLNLGYMKSSTKGSDDKSSTTLFAAGPFARYYIPSGKIYTFLEASAVFGSETEKDNYGSDDHSTFKIGVTNYGGGVGLAIPIGNKATFDTMVGYNSLIFKNKDDDSDNAKYVIGTFGFKFGFHFYL